MAREVKIQLDGIEYTVPALNMKQLQRVAEAIEKPSTQSGFGILNIAMERATPKPDPETFAPMFTEIAKAVEDILKTSGLEIKTDPPKP